MPHCFLACLCSDKLINRLHLTRILNRDSYFDAVKKTKLHIKKRYLISIISIFLNPVFSYLF